MFQGMKREEARKLFEDKAWDTTEKSTKDLTRYQSDPGQATAYMIGQLSIWKMRNYTEQKLKEKGIPFNAQEFHYHILSQGSSPLDYLNTYIKEYVECKINSKNPDCRELLNPKSKKTTSESKSNRINEDEWPVKFRPHMEHYD